MYSTLDKSLLKRNDTTTGPKDTTFAKAVTDKVARSYKTKTAAARRRPRLCCQTCRLELHLFRRTATSGQLSAEATDVDIVLDLVVRTVIKHELPTA